MRWSNSFFDSRPCTNAALRVATTCSRSACDVRSCPRSGAPHAISSPRADIPTAPQKMRNALKRRARIRWPAVTSTICHDVGVPTHIALLRGVNNLGGKRVAMAELRDVVAALGHTDGMTYIHSGN